MKKYYLLLLKYTFTPMLSTLGIKTIDASVPRGDGRLFRCHVILLFWTGDYPAQASVSGMNSKRCHWCTLKAEHAPEVTRMMWRGMRRYLRTFLFLLRVCTIYRCLV
jgi:hypothetical protein